MVTHRDLGRQPSGAFFARATGWNAKMKPMRSTLAPLLVLFVASAARVASASGGDEHPECNQENPETQVWEGPDLAAHFLLPTASETFLLWSDSNGVHRGSLDADGRLLAESPLEVPWS